MPSEKSSINLKQGLQPLKKSSNLSLPPLENLSLNMPIDTSTLKEENQKTSDQEKGISTSSDLEIEKPPRSAKFKRLEKQYTQQVQQIAVLVAPFSLKDAGSIAEQASVLADATISFSEVNKPFCEALENVLNATPLIAMISAYAGLFSAILSNHGINPIENMLKKQAEKNGNAGLPGFFAPVHT